MIPIIQEWGGSLIRWVHVIAAAAWIGASFYFMHLDASLKPVKDLPGEKGGEAWEVHGGGFYHVRKYFVAPASLPEHLIWHKWQSYATWLSGFALLCWVYYLRADLYLIDPAVLDITPAVGAAIGIAALAVGWIFYDLANRSGLADRPLGLACFVFLLLMASAYGFQHVFSGRAAMLHCGAVIATWMTANVFFVIIPNQRKTVAALIAGRAPEPRWAQQAKNRSAHNNYLTLPVLFLMLSGHYPLAWSTPYAWVIVGLIVIAGGIIRHFYNVRNAGGPDLWGLWAVAAVAIMLAVGISAAGSPAAPEIFGAAPAPGTMAPTTRAAVVPEDVQSILLGRCSMCHAEEPVWDGIAAAPKGVMLDTPTHMARFAPLVRIQAVLTHAMPPNNITDLQPDERQTLARWLAGRD